LKHWLRKKVSAQKSVFSVLFELHMPTPEREDVVICVVYAGIIATALSQVAETIRRRA